MKLPWKKIGLSLGISLLILGSLITAFYYSLQPQAGRTNILVLGVAGEDYKGSDLTDSIFCREPDRRKFTFIFTERHLDSFFKNKA